MRLLCNIAHTGLVAVTVYLFGREMYESGRVIGKLEQSTEMIRIIRAREVRK